MDFVNNFYSGNYKRYILVPAVLFILAMFLILAFPGVKLSVDLKGGTNIIVRADQHFEAKALYPALNQKYDISDLEINSVSGPLGNGLFIKFFQETNLFNAKQLLDQSRSLLATNPEQAKALAQQSITYSAKFGNTVNPETQSPADYVRAADDSYNEAEKNFDLGMQQAIRETYGLAGELRYQKSEVGPTVGQVFYNTAIIALVLGIILLSIVIFLYFKETLTAITVIAASLFNIVVAVAVMSIFGINVSLTTIPALLMLIGYSVDTEIVMSSRVLKTRENTAKERLVESLGTIFTMSFTAIASVTALVVFSYFAQISVLFEISSVLLFGLIADIVSSSLMNAPIILAHAEREQGESR